MLIARVFLTADVEGEADLEEQVLAPESVTNTSSVRPVEEITKKEAHITGDRGNPDYAKELERGKSSIKIPVLFVLN